MNPGMALLVTSARRVVDQMPDMLGFPFGRRGAGPFMSGAGLPLPLARARARSGGETSNTPRPIVTIDKHVLTMVFLASEFEPKSTPRNAPAYINSGG